MEGGVYICEWKAEKGKYRGWVKGKKTVSATVTDLEELREALAEEICEWNGDGEAMLEFIPDLPPLKSPNWLDRESVILLGFGDRVETDLADRGAWMRPRCSKCQWADNQNRNLEFTATLARMPKSDLAADAEHFGRSFLSKQLANLINASHFGIKLLPVRIEGSADERYFELVHEPQLRIVGVKGANYDESVSNVCPKCKTATIIPTVDGHWDIQNYLAQSDLQRIKDPVFVIGRPGRRNAIGIQRPLWNKLRRKPGAKGITTSPVGIVSDAYAVRTPKLPVLATTS